METNKRLDDVMKSNMNLQSMLQTMLSSLSCTDVARDKNLIRTGTPILGETSGNGTDVDFHKEGESGGLGSSEQWWNVLCRTSDDKAYGDDGSVKRAVTNPGMEHQVHRNEGLQRTHQCISLY